MSKKNDVIESTAEEVKDQNNSEEASSTEEKGLEKAHPVKDFVVKIGKGIVHVVTSKPAKIVAGAAVIGGAVAGVYYLCKNGNESGTMGAEALLGTGDGTGSDQSANENTDN